MANESNFPKESKTVITEYVKWYNENHYTQYGFTPFCYCDFCNRLREYLGVGESEPLPNTGRKYED